MENETGSPGIVVDLYNRFSRSGRAGQDMGPAPIPMSPEDAASLRVFIEMYSAAAHRAILAYQDQQGVDWFTSGHAERFLTREYCITRRVLDGRERGVLCFRDLSFLSNQLARFAPNGVYGLLGSLPVGAYIRPLSCVDTQLLRRMDEITWPPANPVQELKEARGLSQKALAGLLNTSTHRVRNLLNGECPLSEPAIRKLSELLDVPMDRIQVAYDMHRSDTILHVESPGKWIVPRMVGAQDLPRGMEGVNMEIAVLSFRICSTLLDLLRSNRPRIERCTYCGNLYLPKPRSHRHARNYCCDRHRQRYDYENPSPTG